MELQLSSRKFYTPYDPYPPHEEDYSEVPFCTEPDQYYSLQTIMELSISGQLGNVRIYDDYDDSEEGAEYEFGTDQFEYRQQLIDNQSRTSQVNPSVDLPTDPSADISADLPTDSPAE